MKVASIINRPREVFGVVLRWLCHHPFWRGVLCGLAILLAAGGWAGHYVYFNVPLMPFKPTCSLPYSGHPDDPQYAEIEGEMTEEFLQAAVAEFATFKDFSVLRKNKKLYITLAEWLTHDERKESFHNFEFIQKERNRQLITAHIVGRILEGREGVKWWDVDPDKYGIAKIGSQADCEDALLPRLAIVGGDLAVDDE